MFSFLKGDNIQCAYPTIKETLPASTLGYQSNNRFQSFPPLMNDGRSLISSWQPESFVNNHLLKQNNIQSNWQYRRFLQQNAAELMEHNRVEACNDTGFIVRDVNPPVYVGSPKLYSSVQDDSKAMGEQESDLKELYLSRERLDSRKIAPEMTQAELVQKYGVRL
jgi:hypothetical protein